MNWSYIVIPFIALAAAGIGSLFTVRDVMLWYATIKKPAWTPGGGFIGTIWTLLYAASAVAALIIWNTVEYNFYFWIIIAIFILNVLLNGAWSYIFFRMHLLREAMWEAIALEATTLALILLVLPVAPLAAELLLPYFVWVFFAIVLNYKVWQLNK